MSYYLHTPTDEEVRGAITRFDLAWTDGGAAFDRWLAARDAAALTAAAPFIQAATLRDAAELIESAQKLINIAPGQASDEEESNFTDWDEASRGAWDEFDQCVRFIRARADRLEGETE